MAGTEVIGRGAVYLELDNQLESGFSRLRASIDDLEMTVGEMQRGATNWGHEFVEAFNTVGETLVNVGGAFMTWGENVRASIRGVVDTFMEAGTRFQSLRSRFDFEFGAAGTESWERVLDIAARTSLSTADVVDQTIMLQRSGIDSLSSMVRTRTGEMIPALEAMSDLAATKGERGAFLMQRLMQQFFSGTNEQALSHLRVLFDLPDAQMQIYSEALASATTAQERFEAFAQITAELFGGAGRAMGNTWAFQIAQLSDQWEIFRYEVINGFLDAMAPVVGFFVELLQRMRDVEERTGAFSATFDAIGATVAFVVDNVLRPFADAVLFILENVPLAIPLFVGLAAALSVVATVAGLALTSLGAIIPMIASAVVVSANWASFMAGVTAFFGIIEVSLTTIVLPAMLTLGAAVAAVAVAGGLIWAAWETDFMHIRSNVERITLVFRGLWEVLSSTFSGVGEMSLETGDALHEAGLLDFVVTTSSAVYRLGVAMEGMWSGLTTGFAAAWRVIGPMLGEILGISSDFLGGGTDQLVDTNLSLIERFANTINGISAEQWESFGKQAGSAIAAFVVALSQAYEVISFVHEVVVSLDAAMNNWTATWQSLIGFLQQALAVMTQISLVLSPSTAGTFSALMGLVGPVRAPTAADAVRTAAGSATAPMGPQAVGANQGRAAVAGAASGRSTGAAAVYLDGRRVGEMIGEIGERARASLGLAP